MKTEQPVRLWWQHSGCICGQTGHWGVSIIISANDVRPGLTHATKQACDTDTHEAISMCKCPMYFHVSPHLLLRIAPWYRYQYISILQVEKTEAKKCWITCLRSRTRSSTSFHLIRQPDQLKEVKELAQLNHPDYQAVPTLWYSPPLGQWECKWWVEGGTLSGKSDRTHTRPHIVCFHLYEISRIRKSIETENRWLSARSWKW